MWGTFAAFLYGWLLLFSASSAVAESSIQWSRRDVIGLALSLDDPTIVEVLRFGQNGLVAATFGQKSGPVTGPILKWRIVDGVLEISSDNSSEQFTLLSKDGKSMTVRNQKGKILRFKIVGR
ncbi:MAG: hypothetical protein GC139_08950 [Sideroxydans sp.]|nr:hypothetical protein [Sideroxydans sp.]